jgi:hypothetical protein
MPEQRQEQHRVRTHRHLLGHIIATIVLAALAAIAAWLLLASTPQKSPAGLRISPDTCGCVPASV